MMRLVNLARRGIETLRRRIRREWERWGPAWQLRVIEDNALPVNLPCRTVVLLRDDGEDWSAAMRCPCGCGDTIELMLIRDAKPRWDVNLDAMNRATLHPSIWRKTGCRSHFWVRSGRVAWCE